MAVGRNEKKFKGGDKVWVKVGVLWKKGKVIRGLDDSRWLVKTSLHRAYIDVDDKDIYLRSKNR